MESEFQSNRLDKDFRYFISPLKNDFCRITVQRLKDGMTMTKKIKGNYKDAEILCQKIMLSLASENKK